MRLQIFLQHSVCISFEYISQNKIAESYFQFFMLFYAFSPSNSTYLQPHQQVTRVIFSLHLWHVVPLVFLMVTILTSVRWYITVVLICISLTISHKGFDLVFFSNPLWLMAAAAAAAKSLQWCPTLCDPIDGSPLGSSVRGILQARILEWVAISFSNAWKWKVKVKSFSRVRLFTTPWTAAYQAPPSMGFARQEYWSGVPSPSPRCH